MMRRTLYATVLALSLITGCEKPEPEPDLVYDSWQLEPYHKKHLNNWIGDFPELNDKQSYYTLYGNLKRRSQRSVLKPDSGIFSSPIKNTVPTFYEGYMGLWIELENRGTRFVRFSEKYKKLNITKYKIKD
ncbi:hypothetical protein GF386_03905 [Candidatus Pacearchaeota archaeon]|nr:hypothetical protein [Candidatus Pacearchaeota archaeon]MBD3283292.1 hypothetical protein [Candidatus Pacearchaeota archaeon]